MRHTCAITQNWATGQRIAQTCKPCANRRHVCGLNVIHPKPDLGIDMNTVLLLDHSFKLSCKIADTLFRSDINVFRVTSEEHCAQEANRLAPTGIIVAISDGSDEIQVLLQTLLRNRKVPVIVISENHDEAEELAALQLGVSAFLDGDASCELIAARILHGLNIGLVERDR